MSIRLVMLLQGRVMKYWLNARLALLSFRNKLLCLFYSSVSAEAFTKTRVLF